MAMVARMGLMLACMVCPALAEDVPGSVLGPGAWFRHDFLHVIFNDTISPFQTDANSAGFCLQNVLIGYGAAAQTQYIFSGNSMQLGGNETCQRLHPGATQDLCTLTTGPRGNKLAEDAPEWRNYTRIQPWLYRATRMSAQGDLLQPHFYSACFRDDGRGVDQTNLSSDTQRAALLRHVVSQGRDAGLPWFDPDSMPAPSDVPDLIPGPDAPDPARMAALGWPGPGIWLATAPGEELTPGTPEFEAACFDTPTLIFPDHRVVTLSSDHKESFTHRGRCAPDPDGLPLALCSGALVPPSGGIYGQYDLMMTFRADGPLRIRADRWRRDGLALPPQSFTACLRTDGSGIEPLENSDRGRRLRHLAELSVHGEPRFYYDIPRSVQAQNNLPFPPAAADPAGLDEQLTGLWFQNQTGARPALLSRAEVSAACRAAPAFLHPDGVFMAFGIENGLPVVNSHMTCGPDLNCAYAPGAPADAQPAIGMARLTIHSPLEITACLGAACVELGRCPAPDWTGLESVMGLPAQWESRVSAR